MSDLPATVNLAAYRGDSWQQTFRFLRGGVTVDMSESTLKSQARAPDGGLYELPLDLTDAAAGTVTLQLPAGGLPYGYYDYDLEETALGDLVTTWVRGQLRVTRDVTNELPEVVTSG